MCSKVMRMNNSEHNSRLTVTDITQSTKFPTINTITKRIVEQSACICRKWEYPYFVHHLASQAAKRPSAKKLTARPLVGLLICAENTPPSAPRADVGHTAHSPPPLCSTPQHNGCGTSSSCQVEHHSLTGQMRLTWPSKHSPFTCSPTIQFTI